MRTLLILMTCALASFGGVSTPAERAIASAHETIKKTSDKPDAWVALATALLRRARETGSNSYLKEADSALAEAFKLQPGDFVASRTRVSLLIAQSNFAEALKLAVTLQKKIPDDVTVYALLCEAHRELGNYKEAEEAGQWLLDMGRNSVGGLVQAARLREVFGDPEGALDFYKLAYTRIDPAESEERAWLLTRTGLTLLTMEKNEDAAQAIEQAQQLFPDYPFAMASMAKVRLAQAKYDDAVQLLRRVVAVSPAPEHLFNLAVALKKSGSYDEANSTFANFERKASAMLNSNTELSEYYADYADKPADALRIAAAEKARRHDVNTLDSYAWALYRSKRYDEAQRVMDEALATGTRTPHLLRHSAAIRSAKAAK